MHSIAALLIGIATILATLANNTDNVTQEGRMNARLMFESTRDGKRACFYFLDITVFRENGIASSRCKLVRFFEHKSLEGDRPVIRLTVFDEVRVKDVWCSATVDQRGSFSSVTCTLDMLNGEEVRLTMNDVRHNGIQFNASGRGTGISHIPGEEGAYDFEWRQVEGFTPPPGVLIYPL